MSKDFFKSYKYFKIVQLIILIVFGVAFFCVLYFNKTLRGSVYSDKNLLTICIFLWAFMIYSLISLIWDFRQLEGNINHDNLMHQAAFFDTLTGIPNRRGCDQLFSKYSNNADISELGCVLCSLSNIDTINKSFGREAGNTLLKDFSQIFEQAGTRFGFAGRNSGNEFLAVIEKCSEKEIDSFINILKSSIDEYNADDRHEHSLELSVNYILNKNLNTTDFSELISQLYTVAKDK